MADWLFIPTRPHSRREKIRLKNAAGCRPTTDIICSFAALSTETEEECSYADERNKERERERECKESPGGGKGS